MKHPLSIALGTTLVSVCLVVAGCGGSDDELPGTGGGAWSGSGGTGATSSASNGASGGAGVGGGGGAGPSNCVAVDRRCAHVFEYPAGAESSVEVRGNFAPDGWDIGVAMVKDGSSWKATVPVSWGVSIQYKFLVDGSTWVTDPGNAEQIEDGLGGYNSLLIGPKCAEFSCIAEPALRFAVIGDFGAAALGQGYADSEAAVAALVDAWSPELIATVGDNNYPDGAAETIDENIGQFYHAYISPYEGSYGAGASSNRFFPCLGNHDWNPGNVQAYTDYFSLPGNERYWDVAWGPVHLFCIDSEPQEPDGDTAESVQGAWLQDALGKAREPFRLVLMHRPPYSSGEHHSTPNMQWPFADWGASAVMAGHDHDYERLDIGGTPYFVDGFGGAEAYGFTDLLPESKMRYSGGFGAVLVEVSADEKTITWFAVSTDGVLRDHFAMSVL